MNSTRLLPLFAAALSLTRLSGLAQAQAPAGTPAADPVAAQEPVVITIKTPPGQMKYDRPVISATPGAKLRLIFENQDEMPHNLVLCKPLEGKEADKGLEVAQLAWQMGVEGMNKNWIPDSPRILAHTSLVPAHQKEELFLTVPMEPGIYPYVCTFPGHAMVMNGELRVLSEGPKLTELNYKLYLGDWRKLPDYSTLTPHRSGPLPDKLVDIKLEGMTEHFGVRYEGTFETPQDGRYEFFLSSDDGSRLSIDGRAILDNDGIHPASTVKSRSLRLTKGPHKLMLDYFEATGEEKLYLGWSSKQFSETALSKWVPPSRQDSSSAEAPADQYSGIPLGPRNGEAIIYRNFIAGSSPRGIAVGYPNGTNLCFDADQMAPALFWRGAFMDAKRHWTDRGSGAQPPLGYDVFSPTPDAPALTILADANAPWPAKKQRAEGIRFRGYTLDAQRRPTFKYDLGCVSVEEFYEPVGDTKNNDGAIMRHLTLTCPQAPGGLYLRAASGNLQPREGGVWAGQGFQVKVVKGSAQLREPNGAGAELLVPVKFDNNRATLSLLYRWNS